MMEKLIGVVALYAVPFLLAFAAIMDIMYRRIPNKVVLALFLLFFPTAWLAGLGWEQVLEHLVVFAVLLVVGFLLFLPGWFGSGDGKMLAVCGLWLGWPETQDFLVMTVLLGGLYAFVKLIADSLLFEGGIWFPRLAEGRLGRLLFGRKITIPYGVPLAAGILAVLPLSLWAKVHLMNEGMAGVRMAAGF